MKVALYARVSTSEEKQFQDPEVQISILKMYCELNGPQAANAFVDQGPARPPKAETRTIA